ncbi:MAG: methyltransferase domain-containing protein [Patescibacteria group bacterium]
MTYQDLLFLLSKEGKELTNHLSEKVSDGKIKADFILRLKKNYPGINIRSIVEIIMLRKRAEEKFKKASEMWFTKDGLEQSTREDVARYVAKRFKPYNNVADLTCGIGGNSIALAEYSNITAVDKDEVVLKMAEENAKVYLADKKITFINDYAENIDLSTFDAVFLDPSRRDIKLNTRTTSLRNSTPSLISFLPKILSQVGHVGVKVSPAVNYEEIYKLSEIPEIEVIAEENECKQIMLWFGNLKTTERRATILPYEISFTNSTEKLEVPISEPLNYILEPNCAIIRAHLIDELANEYDLKKIDPDIAYLTSNIKPFLKNDFIFKTFKVMEISKYNIKNLKKKLRDLKIKNINITRRGFPKKPEEIRKLLKIKEGGDFFLLLTRIGDKHYQIIAKRI